MTSAAYEAGFSPVWVWMTRWWNEVFAHIFFYLLFGFFFAIIFCHTLLKCAERSLTFTNTHKRSGNSFIILNCLLVKMLGGPARRLRRWKNLWVTFIILELKHKRICKVVKSSHDFTLSISAYLIENNWRVFYCADFICFSKQSIEWHTEIYFLRMLSLRNYDI